MPAMTELLPTLTTAAALGSGLVAGIFFAFSTFVMRALAQLPPAQGIAAMQAINVTVLNRWFLGVFLGTAALCLAVAILALVHTTGVHRTWLLAASAFYLFGCLLVTGTLNVPLNDRLATTDCDDTSGHKLWTHYLSRWTFWNHVRTAASFAAATLFAMKTLGGTT